MALHAFMSRTSTTRMRAAGTASYGATETFTRTFDQQHCRAPGPPPVASSACRFKRYSPGSLKIAVVVTLALKGVPGGGDFNWAGSAGGLSLANFTAPGPRNMIH